jgi:CheY-like chemotaxis protein
MTCEVANNGLEALQRIRQLSSVDNKQDAKEPFDVVLMDLEMPVMGGLACIRQIREEELMGRLHRSTVWALTGNARQAQIDEAMSQGMDMGEWRSLSVTSKRRY